MSDAELRLDVLNDLRTLSIEKFGLKYDDVLVEDGIIKYVHRRDTNRPGYFSYAGRRYFHTGPLWRK